MRSLFCFRFLSGLLALGLSSCISARPPSQAQANQQKEELRSKLYTLNPSASSDDVEWIAQQSVDHSVKLMKEYRLVTPAWWQNVLVNLQVKPRGLCYQWTEDLSAHLLSRKISSFDLHWGEAYPDKIFRAHNSVTVTAPNAPFETGYVLDPWRKCGTLVIAPVTQDKYPWTLNPSWTQYMKERAAIMAEIQGESSPHQRSIGERPLSASPPP